MKHIFIIYFFDLKIFFPGVLVDSEPSELTCLVINEFINDEASARTLMNENSELPAKILAIPLGPQFGPIFQFSYCQTYGQVIDVTNHGKWSELTDQFFQSLQHPWLTHLLDKMKVEKEITRGESSDVLSCGNRRFIRKSILLSFEGGCRIIDPTWAILKILIYVYKQLWQLWYQYQLLYSGSLQH